MEIPIRSDTSIAGIGEFDRHLMKISVKTPALAPVQVASTILHECLHAMLYIYGLHHVLRLDEANEEILVSVLEPAIFAFIRDNPALIKEIQKVK